MKLYLYTHGKGQYGNSNPVQYYEAPTIHIEGKDTLRFVLHHESGLKTVTSNLPFILES